MLEFKSRESEDIEDYLPAKCMARGRSFTMALVTHIARPHGIYHFTGH